MPVEHVREHAAEQNPDNAAARKHEAKDAHRLRPVGRLGEESHDKRQRDRRDDGAADSLHRPRDDQELLGVCESAEERGNREERNTRQEQPPVAEEIAQPPAEQQEAAEREQIGVHHPRQRRLAEAEVVANRREGDVHDRPVEDDHQVAETQDVESEPATAVIQGHGIVLSLRSSSVPSLRRLPGVELIGRKADEFGARGPSNS